MVSLADATDVEENLPQPTPVKNSKLQRLHRTTSKENTTAKPQIIRRENKNGPFLGSWVADPDRPICIIDGNKKTILLPSNQNRFLKPPENNSYPPPHVMELLENQLWSLYGAGSASAAPTPSATDLENLPELDSMDFNFFQYPNGSRPINGQYKDFDQLLEQEYGTESEESFDEDEQALSLEDVLMLEEFEGPEDGKTLVRMRSASDATDMSAFIEGLDDDTDGTAVNGNAVTDSEATPTKMSNDVDADRMWQQWNRVSVTAFRKRQQQHKQRISGQDLAANRVIKGKLSIADTTMTPARRRKIRASSSTPVSNRHKRKNSHLSPLIEESA